MEDVEALVRHDARDLVGEVEAQGDARHRVVDRDGDRSPDPVEAGGVESDIGPAGGSEDPALVAERLELDREVAHVIVHAAGRREVVRGDESYFHLKGTLISW